VASQQGLYLSRLFTRGYDLGAAVPAKAEGAPRVLSETLGLSSDKSGRFAKGFSFMNLGILAYVSARYHSNVYQIQCTVLLTYVFPGTPACVYVYEVHAQPGLVTHVSFYTLWIYVVLTPVHTQKYRSRAHMHWRAPLLP
jgi:hypothetical protein